MLARTYKTAAELGLLDHEFAALWKVVLKFEDGSLKREKINMGEWCGTHKCIGGWAHYFDPKAFPEIDAAEDGPSSESYLRMRRRLPMKLLSIFSGTIEVPEGAIATLRTFLETGE